MNKEHWLLPCLSWFIFIQIEKQRHSELHLLIFLVFILVNILQALSQMTVPDCFSPKYSVWPWVLFGVLLRSVCELYSCYWSTFCTWSLPFSCPCIRMVSLKHSLLWFVRNRTDVPFLLAVQTGRLLFCTNGKKFRLCDTTTTSLSAVEQNLFL